MPFEPTSEQRKAINTDGNILVSAAAGSGKTAVLVERVIKKLCDKENCISADRLLIVTYTNAAAAEMRSRIEARLDKEIENNREDTTLLLQKSKLCSAKICTIDSFCIDLVRENFEKLDIEPDFKISDGNSLSVTDRKVLEKIFVRYLEENNPDFRLLLDILGCQYNEQNFFDIVNGMFLYSRQLPLPKEWFKALSDNYKKFDSQNVFANYCFETADKAINQAFLTVKNARELLSFNEEYFALYYPSFSETMDLLMKLADVAKKREWDLFYSAAKEFSFKKLPQNRKLEKNEQIEIVKEIYGKANEKLRKLLNRLFGETEQEIDLEFKKVYNSMLILTDILTEYEESLFNAYKQANTFTFHNTEHLALKLLCDEKDSALVPSVYAEEYLSRFDEVLVDEYQDTNDLQDRLFYILSSYEKKLFVVGDVKQSIYGFRGTNPINFLNKKKRYFPIDEAQDDAPKKIILGNNFRCKKTVCDFVNFFFGLFMNDETGEIVYDKEEELVCTAKFPEFFSDDVRLDIIEKEETSLQSAELEAVHIADYIEKTMKSGNIIREDDNTLRPAKYSDFALLMRSVKSSAQFFAEELKRRGIPVTYVSEEFCETTEISTFLSLLKVIDNPKSDIELLCTMMSPIFMFSPEEMAEIRIGEGYKDLYSSVVKASINGDTKVQAFLKRLELYRLMAVTNLLPSLISRLLADTDYLDIVSSLSDGEKRRNNLLLLIKYAENYVAEYGNNLSGFVNFILKQSNIKGATGSGGDDAVRIMTIHGSKGLQFPICIIACCEKEFNDQESKEKVLYSTDFGLGFNYYSESERKLLKLLPHRVILDNVRRKRATEELRLLYVAMTRTQDRLLFVTTVKGLETKLEKFKKSLVSSDSKISFETFSGLKSYSDWLLTALLLHPAGKDFRKAGHSLILSETDSKLAVNVINDKELIYSIKTKQSKKPEADTNLKERIIENINYTYPYEELLNVESKASVSQLANSAESQKYSFKSRPQFMCKEGMTASKRGTAMHKCLQFFDFSKCDKIDEELERLYEWKYITESEYRCIDRDRLALFFESNIFLRIKKASLVKREMRFLTEMSAKRIAPQLDERFNDVNIIVQGAVDVCFIENDEIVILDFKTDRIDNPEVLVSTYGEQLNIYALACEKIFKKPVKEKIIYSFYLGREVKISG